jgi:hypothetical protein
MLIERRNFADIYHNHRDDVISVHIFTDGSPVTGSEIQGMVLQLVMRDGAIKQIVLPGVCLHYCHCAAIDKAIALLWALHLILGPSLIIMEWLLFKVKSITTDMGTEVHILDCPNILQAFLRRRQGLPMALLEGTVNQDSRLLASAIRLPDWSHVFGNLMKYASKQTHRWPEILDLLRALCRFFRYEPWRKVLKEDARIKAAIPDITILLKSFTARLAKWRYETLFNVFFQLLKLRGLCEGELAVYIEVLFPRFQDGELLKQVRIACRWKDLWIFMDVFFENTIYKLEKGRRWGLVCACCQADRHTEPFKRSKCIWASRRLKEARVFFFALVDDVFAATNDRGLFVRCSGVQWIFQSLSFSGRRTGSEMKLKGKFLKLVPWRVAESEDPEQAAVCAEQLRTTSESRMSPLELRYKQKLLPSLEVLYNIQIVPMISPKQIT